MSYANEMASHMNLLLSFVSQVRLELMVDGEVQNWIVIGWNWIQFWGSFGWNGNFVRALTACDKLFSCLRIIFFSIARARVSAYQNLNWSRKLWMKSERERKTGRGRIIDTVQRIFLRKCKHDVIKQIWQQQFHKWMFANGLVGKWNRFWVERWV